MEITVVNKYLMSKLKHYCHLKAIIKLIKSMFQVLRFLNTSLSSVDFSSTWEIYACLQSFV